MTHNGVALNRALSKLGIMSRAEATEAVRQGRVQVNGRVVLDPATRVIPERAHLTVDGTHVRRDTWRTIVFHKPRGVVTTRRDPEGRRTIYDVLGDAERGLVAVGRLDLASSGLLLLTNDTRLAEWVTNPLHAVPRIYVVTVRGRVDPDGAAALTAGIVERGERLRAQHVGIRKASSRETHLVVELREGRNREIRRLLASIGHEVTRLKRVGLGRLELGSQPAGAWREVSRAEISAAFPGITLGR